MAKFQQLKCFVTIVEKGSINKAAEELFMSQPTMSRTLKALEDEIGRPLLLRKNQGIVPTREGNVLYIAAKSILSQMSVIDKLKNLHIDDIVSELNVAVYALYCSNKVFWDFYDECRADNIQLNLQEMTIEPLLESVSTGHSEIGVAVILESELGGIQKAAKNRGVEIEILAEGPLYLHIGERNPFYGKETVRMRDMLNSTLLTLPFDSFSGLRKYMMIGDVFIQDFSRIMMVDNYRVLASMLKHTNGIQLGNQWQAEDMKKFGIESKMVEDCSIKNYLAILKNSQVDILSLSGQKFIESFKRYYLGGGE